MRILICNDDGIDSGGLKTLANKLAERHEVVVVAPEENRSCCSHTLSLNIPIGIRERTDAVGYRVFETTGYPVDCVKIGFHYIKDFVPDVVVAGINKAHNLGTDVMYSGTVAIALEAAYFGKPAFAFSAYSHNEIDFCPSAEIALKIIEKLVPLSKPGEVWNVNFPPDNVEISGVKFCGLGRYVYDDKYIKDGERFVLKSSAAKIATDDINSDVCLVEKGYVTITPLSACCADKDKIREMNDLCEKSLL